MKILAKTELGGVEFQFIVAETTQIETLHKAIVLSNPPTNCDECGNKGRDKFRWDTNKDKDKNVYINIMCKSCGAKAKLGQYKGADGGYFWRTFEKYIPKNQQNNSSGDQSQQSQNGPPPPDDDDLPF